MEDLYKFKNRGEYIKALDSILPESYIQTRKVASGTHKYYPAPIKEAVADDLFHYWNVIDESYTALYNEILCTVKIVYCPSYPGADELFCTGSASTPVQMDANSDLSNFPNNKKKNALEYGVPNVQTEAISNALGRLGNIFGRNLNRKINKDTYLPDNFTIRKHNIEPEQKKPEKPVQKIDVPF